MPHFTALDILAAVVVGGAASAVGGFFGGKALAAKFIGRDLAGYLGMLYGPPAGLTGVVAGLVVISIISARS